jgi:hypothetical protein
VHPVRAALSPRRPPPGLSPMRRRGAPCQPSMRVQRRGEPARRPRPYANLIDLGQGNTPMFLLPWAGGAVAKNEAEPHRFA